MGAQQSKDELLYEQVSYGNVDGILTLRRDGAGLEWIDKEGRTPLILASMRPELLHVVRVLIDLGANLNAYRPGSHAGTALHHAAKRGLTQTVELLLSRGANPLVMNDDCQTALELARTKGHCNVVRLIEARICLFSGWLRETHGPSILESIIRQWVSKKIWAVILPCDTRNPSKQPKCELAVYSGLQVAEPSTVIQLWKVHVEEPVFSQLDPPLVLVDKATQKRHKFLSGNEGDKQQLQLLYNACRGIPQNNTSHPAAPALMSMPNTSQLNSHASTAPSSVPQSAPEDVELAMAINASIQMAIAEGVRLEDARPTTGASDLNGWEITSGDATHNGWGLPDGAAPSKASTQPQMAIAEGVRLQDARPTAGASDLSGWEISSGDATHNGWGLSDGAAPSKASTQPQLNEPNVDPYNGWAGPEVRPSGPAPKPLPSEPGTSVVSSSVEEIPAAVPSAPPITEDALYGSVHYPSIDSSPVDLTVPAWEEKPGTSEVKEAIDKYKEGSSISGSCVICLDAPVEGACIPCGHVAGCMSCLKEIRAKKWGCPVCRAKIDQVIKLYAV